MLFTCLCLIVAISRRRPITAIVPYDLPMSSIFLGERRVFDVMITRVGQGYMTHDWSNPDHLVHRATCTVSLNKNRQGTEEKYLLYIIIGQF